MNKRSGFTLIELLVAITVLAIVAVLGWRGLDTIIRSRIALTQDLERTRGIQLAFAQLQNDCAQIASPVDIGGRRALQTGGDRITMIRGVFTENQPSRMQVVAYRLRDGQLTRYESVPTRDVKELDSMWQAAISDTSTGQGVALESDVGAMLVQSWYSDTPGWRNDDATGQGIGTTGSTSSTTGTTGGTGTTSGTTGSATPTTPAAAMAAAAAGRTPIGLQVSLQMNGHNGSMVKVFLLGAT